MKKYIIALLGFIPFLGFSQEIHPCGQVHAMDDFFKSHPEERAIAAAAKIELEELGDVPTHYQLVKIVQELTLKMIKKY